MASRRIDAKMVFKLMAIILGFFAIVFFMRVEISLLKPREKIPDFEAMVQVQATSLEDESFTYNLEVMHVREKTLVRPDGSRRPIYVEGSRVIVDKGSKYEYYEDDNNISRLYKVIDGIDLGDTIDENGLEKMYNPVVPSETVNDILKMLFIDKETTRNERAHVVVREGRRASFSLYLIGIEGYKDVNITISFSKENREELNLPVFHSVLMDKSSFEDLAIIK